MEKTNKIYVAGHRGLVGFALLRRLQQPPSPLRGKGWGGGAHQGHYTNLTIRELAETVTGYTGKIMFDTTKPDGTPRKLMDVGRLNAMGWRARVSMQRGLKEAYADYCQSQH